MEKEETKQSLYDSIKIKSAILVNESIDEIEAGAKGTNIFEYFESFKQKFSKTNKTH